MFAALEYKFVGVELMFEGGEHKLLRSKNTFYFRFHQINQPILTEGQKSCEVHRGGNTVKYVKNENYSAKSGDFLSFFAYLCHVNSKQ